MPSKSIMTSSDIGRSLARIAHQIIERNKTADNLALIGIRTRGVPIAERLADAVGNLGNTVVPVGCLDISPYRDDLCGEKIQPEVQNTSISFDIDGKEVILVDDVLFTGRSIRAAMDAIIDRGRPRSIQLAVLVDRGHRELPIRADYVGKNVPSARHEDIRVKLVETDGIDEVVIVQTGEEYSDKTGMTGGTVRKER